MDVKEDLVRHYRWLRQYGYNDSHSGNASVRDGEDVWITPSGACADTLQANDLVHCHIDGECSEGGSLDAELHLSVYRHNPRAQAVLHSHGPYTVAMTLDGNDYVPCDFEGGFYFPRVPVIRIDPERYFDESPEAVSKALAEHSVAIVRGHGIYAWGRSINLAYKWTCSLELSVKTCFLARQAGTLR